MRGESVRIDRIVKSYGSAVALAGVDLKVEPGEFVALLGPSGSGKTTLLMTVAGFESPDSGTVHIGDRDVTRVPAHRRGIGFVFQRYALFPHLTVAKNIAYPLVSRGVRAAARADKVAEALRMVDLEGYGARRVDQLSGGQQQRVALARCLVFEPSVMLMDEPLGALDRKLREQVQLELRRLHRSLGATIVFVTHDQQEAMVMADRIVVMDHATIQQTGTPAELYRRPRTPFVAGFLGAMNFLPATVAGGSGTRVDVEVGGWRGPSRWADPDTPVPTAGAVTVAVRPEDVLVTGDGQGVAATVRELIFTGPVTQVVVDAGGVQVTASLRSGHATWRPGDEVSVSWGGEDALTYPNNTLGEST